MASKRSNGKYVGRITVNGRQVYCGTNHLTKKAARAAEEAKRAELRILSGHKPETVDAFAERWTTDYPRPAANTRATYLYASRAVGRAFRGVLLTEVDRVSARGWAVRAAQQNVRAARAMFQDALNDGLVVANPFANMRLEQSRGRKDIEVLTEPELDDLAVIASGEQGDWFAAYLMWLAFTCMRPGEANALDRRDLDVEGQEIAVSKNLDKFRNIKWPKNGKPRDIVLPPPAAKWLARTVRHVEPVRLFDTRVDDWRDFELVFRGKRGGLMTEPKLTSYWAPVRAAFRKEYPQRRLKDPYDLRHAGATLLLERGASAEDVAVQMGHTDGGRLVQELYGHPSQALARERLKRLWAEPTPLRPVASTSQTGVDAG